MYELHVYMLYSQKFLPGTYFRLFRGWAETTKIRSLKLFLSTVLTIVPPTSFNHEIEIRWSSLRQSTMSQTLTAVPVEVSVIIMSGR